MAIINISTLIDSLGGTSVTDAKIVAIASSAGKPATRNVDNTVIFPKRIELSIVAGVPVSNFQLLQLPVGMYWSIGVYVSGLTNSLRTVRLPDGAGPFDFDELVDVSPTTALADPNTAAADVYLAQVQAAADRAEAATYGMAQVSTAVNYTLVLGDAGKHIYVTATGRTITVPANSSVAFAIGTVVTVVNPGVRFDIHRYHYRHHVLGCSRNNRYAHPCRLWHRNTTQTNVYHLDHQRVRPHLIITRVKTLS
jgi:hypothetical protein